MRTLAGLLILLTPFLASGQATGGFISAGQDAQLKGPWSDPAEPFRILANIHYVGGVNIASYLLTTPEGHILLDTGMPRMHQTVRANIETLGFKVRDIKIMISSHAHVDHVGAHAEMQKATGARVMAMAEDAVALEQGKDLSPVEYDNWSAVKVDRVLRDGDTVTLGGTTLRAVWTPGHTPGATTWVTTVQDGGRSYNVVFPGGAAPNAGPLVVGNPKHPTLAEDTLRTFGTLRQLNPDIALPGHPQQTFAGKTDAIKKGVRPHPLLQEPGAWAKGTDAQQAAFMKRIEADKARAPAR